MYFRFVSTTTWNRTSDSLIDVKEVSVRIDLLFHAFGRYGPDLVLEFHTVVSARTHMAVVYTEVNVFRCYTESASLEEELHIERLAS